MPARAGETGFRSVVTVAALCTGAALLAACGSKVIVDAAGAGGGNVVVGASGPGGGSSTTVTTATGILPLREGPMDGRSGAPRVVSPVQWVHVARRSNPYAESTDPVECRPASRPRRSGPLVPRERCSVAGLWESADRRCRGRRSSPDDRPARRRTDASGDIGAGGRRGRRGRAGHHEYEFSEGAFQMPRKALQHPFIRGGEGGFCGDGVAGCSFSRSMASFASERSSDVSERGRS